MDENATALSKSVTNERSRLAEIDFLRWIVLDGHAEVLEKISMLLILHVRCIHNVRDVCGLQTLRIVGGSDWTNEQVRNLTAVVIGKHLD